MTSIATFFSKDLGFPSQTCSKVVKLCEQNDIFSLDILLCLSVTDIERIGFTVGVKQKLLPHLKPNLSLKEIQDYMLEIVETNENIKETINDLQQTIKHSKREIEYLNRSIEENEKTIENLNDFIEISSNLIELQSNPIALSTSSREIKTCIDIIRSIPEEINCGIIKSLTMNSGSYPSSQAQNSLESISDNNYSTGATAASPGIITLTLKRKTKISNIHVSGYFGNKNSWGPSNGSNAKIYCLLKNKQLKEVGSVPSTFGQSQQLYTINIKNPVHTTEIQFKHTGYMGFSNIFINKIPYTFNKKH